MFNKFRLAEILKTYKKDFATQTWENEKYKWEAVKCFQDNWNINATDFKDMLYRSLIDTNNLLGSAHTFPLGMITEFAEAAPERVRALFIALYDESTDYYERIEAFKRGSEEILSLYNKGNWNNHYQDERTITTYLWLRYPDKYYIYKFSVVKEVARELNSNYSFKQGAYADNVRNHLALYNEICSELQKDDELVHMLQLQLTDTCYPDPALKTLTIDVGFYIYQNYIKIITPNKGINFGEWYGTDFDIGLKLDDWISLLKDETVFTISSLEIMKRMMNYGNMATCSQLSQKYGETPDFYYSGSLDLAKRVCEAADITPDTREDGTSWYWSVLYIWCQKKDEQDTFIWKLRKELSNALKYVDLSGIKLYSEGTTSPVKPYTKKDFLEEVYMAEARYDHLVSLLRYKKNLILQGAPGVGKTFAAERLAYSMMGMKDPERVMTVQFHQSYSYEDFVEGFRPSDTGFELVKGSFYTFCKKAQDDIDNDYFFIIDEINRGNLSKIFGELFMLIENDKRDSDNKIQLLYSRELFYVPSNVYLIGMMNTADRSLAMLDYALRRRFSFFEMYPAFESKGFILYQYKLNNDVLNELIERIKELNVEIEQDKSLGRGFCIGHSYFCDLNGLDEEELIARLSEIVDYDILPMLEEYWFDDEKKVANWKNKFHEVLQQ